MTGFALFLEAFHFIRSFWLLLLPVTLLLWWMVRRAHRRPEPVTEGLAPHLAEAMTLGRTAGAKLKPIDGAALCLCLLVIGAAGPTWSRQPEPFVAQSAPLVVVLKVTPSMEEGDVAPSRLERGKQKIRDLGLEPAGAGAPAGDDHA